MAIVCAYAADVAEARRQLGAASQRPDLDAAVSFSPGLPFGELFIAVRGRGPISPWPRLSPGVGTF
eukprot:11023118-Lingulodinium_polyedra.AAC.1